MAGLSPLLHGSQLTGYATEEQAACSFWDAGNLLLFLTNPSCQALILLAMKSPLSRFE
ncbi:MAG TPA: hypothetical protein VFV38_33915 [Ktedonobacteraceae bacterium]|nr:hypothetical protein [Ktedonobacteraceae bacterium]